MPTLTKIDITAIRKADDVCVHLNQHNPDGLVRLIKRAPYNQPLSHDVEHILPAKVDMYTMHGRMALDAGTAHCFAMIGLYHNQYTTASNAMKSLRAGDEVTFSFWPDANTNGYVAAANLHADCLYMHVRRNGKTIARWNIAESICPSNSARMCNGVPNSESYQRDAIEARKVA